tara:strand:- start:897 stop:1118 length:222 start_codon:yes stop_codon:yes gene_type:complete
MKIQMKVALIGVAVALITGVFSDLFSTAIATTAFKHPFVEIIGQSSPFWLNYETKLRGEYQLLSLIQAIHGLY